METTIDRLLNGRLVLEQPAKGFRIAVDTLLLASTIKAHVHERILDLGCGVGGVMLAIACRNQTALITGVEIQPEIAQLCASNIAQNKFEKTLNVVECDATDLNKSLYACFDHVVMNPPFHDAARHGGSPNQSKRRANTEEEGEIEAWIASANSALRENGMITMITRTDRQGEMTALIGKHFGEIQIKPIWSKEDGSSKRVILRAVKGGQKNITVREPFLLYGKDGKYSQGAEEILREVKGMEF